MATYHNITQEEILNFLTPLGFQQIALPGTKELVYGKRIPHKLPLTLRVYSGINPDGNSRGVGEDAIRVNLFWRNQSGEVKKVGGSKRVHRVAGWKNNLKNRLDNWEQDFVICTCGSPMVERKNFKDNSMFLGCCNYPTCRCTRPLKKKADNNNPLNLSPRDLRAEQEVLRMEQRYS